MVKKMYKTLLFLIDLIVSMQPKKAAGFSKFRENAAIFFSKSKTEH